MEALGHQAGAIRFVYPRFTRPVSVTGGECRLDCAHCGGHYLRHMTSLADIDGANADPSSSWLVSGGCTPEGQVPLTPHLDRLRALKGDRRFNLHTGLIDAAGIDALAGLADQVSFDFAGDDATIREVYGLDKTVEDYVACYKQLRLRCRVMPHICIGLHGGEIRGEYRAMELIRDIGADGLTFIIFIPTRGTRFADRRPPDSGAVVNLLTEARQLFPDIPLHLGCMRPGGSYRVEIDEQAVRLGLDSIVNPTPGAVKLAESLGLVITRGEECCAL